VLFHGGERRRNDVPGEIHGMSPGEFDYAVFDHTHYDHSPDVRRGGGYISPPSPPSKATGSSPASGTGQELAGHDDTLFDYIRRI